MRIVERFHTSRRSEAAPGTRRGQRETLRLKGISISLAESGRQDGIELFIAGIRDWEAGLQHLRVQE
jgi:hypothetical protein